MKSWLLRALVLASLGVVAVGCETGGTDDAGSQLSAVGDVTDERLISVPGTSIRIALWNATSAGKTDPYYAIDLGAGFLPAKRTSYVVPLRTRALDPVALATAAPLGTEPDLYVVQYVSQPLDAFRHLVEQGGAEVHQYLHGNAQLVRGDGRAMRRIAALPFVRAIARLSANDRIDPRLTTTDEASLSVVVMLVEPKSDRSSVEARFAALGGTVTTSDPEGILVEGTVDARALPTLAADRHVLWIEQARPIEVDYDVARQQGGADFLEGLPDPEVSLPQYTGIGIRGHIMEGIDPGHPDFAPADFRRAPIGIDDGRPDAHGMATFGIVFGSGAGNRRARGQLPNGQGYYTHNEAVMERATGRSTLVGKLIAENKVMFQTASWGNGLETRYNAKSAEMDALILKHDIPITQSQSNTGTQSSRPQAWAKNIISVGALNHFGTAAPDDDRWNRSGSIGPAADGSIKPDLAFYFDRTITTTLNNGYTNDFGGTSGATPTVAGHVGLTIELWTNGVFGNELIPQAANETVVDFRFKNRPHFTTTKALLVHSARQYAFQGEFDDRTRSHQGWGVPDLEGMYKRRSNMLVVNESDVLQNLQTKTYAFTVPAGAPDFRATLVYADKEATLPTSVHRVNNLDLRVTAPDGTIYWGNRGLTASMTSTPGGEHDVLDTVENVIVAAPRAGLWTIDVIADEINADTHLETPETDAAYALVVSTPGR